MSKIMALPRLGDDEQPVVVSKVLVQVGQEVSEGDIVVEVESDKTSMEIPSELSGSVQEVLVAQGDEITAGTDLFSCAGGEVDKASAAEDTDTTAPRQTEENPQEAPAPGRGSPLSADSRAEQIVHALVPDLGDGIDGAQVSKVLVEVGAEVEEGSPLIELESDKASMEIPSEHAGTVVRIAIEAGNTAQPQDIIAEIKVVGVPQAAQSLAAETKPQNETSKPADPAPSSTPNKADTAATVQVSGNTATPSRSERKLVPAGPYVRRFAREIGIAIGDVPGTGARGRISVEDVKNYSKQLQEQLKTAVASGGVGGVLPQRTLPSFAQWGAIREEPMSRIRRITAEHMEYCNATIPTVTQFDEANVSDLEALRQKYKGAVANSGAKLTMTAILLYVCAHALRRFEALNASVDMQNSSIIFKDYINIGIAVDTPQGLVVPVVRNADQKSILELAADLGELSTKAREKSLQRSDLEGGTFTISNLGGIAGTGFTPIVNWPEVAILGVARSVQKPVVQPDGSFASLLSMPLALSYDHRIIDGALGARFLGHVVQLLEDPFLMQLGL